MISSNRQFQTELWRASPWEVSRDSCLIRTCFGFDACLAILVNGMHTMVAEFFCATTEGLKWWTVRN